MGWVEGTVCYTFTLPKAREPTHIPYGKFLLSCECGLLVSFLSASSEVFTLKADVKNKVMGSQTKARHPDLSQIPQS